MTRDPKPRVSRRQALAAGLAGAAALAAWPGDRGGKETRMSQSERMPVVYLPHGGGPWPFVDVGFGDKSELDALSAYLRSVRELPKTPPKALLCVSAHWEEAVPTVMTSAHPPLLFDYYGFPEASYRLTWPAPGEPRVAARVRELLGAAGFKTAEDAERGFDHGTFVPLKLAWPEAEVPTVQLSLVRGLDPQEHLAMGRALAPLRDEGVYIIGSGMTFHNLRAFGAGQRAGRGGVRRVAARDGHRSRRPSAISAWPRGRARRWRGKRTRARST